MKEKLRNPPLQLPGCRESPTVAASIRRAWLARPQPWALGRNVGLMFGYRRRRRRRRRRGVFFVVVGVVAVAVVVSVLVLVLVLLSVLAFTFSTSQLPKVVRDRQF